MIAIGSCYIRSTEHRTYRVKHECLLRDVIDGNKLLSELSPAIPGWVYGLHEDLVRVVLAPRYTDSTLVPQVSEWPCTVNICIPKDHNDWTCGPWLLLDIGEITRL